jgi:hypothetical protein
MDTSEVELRRVLQKVALLLLCIASTVSCASAQDGASYNPQAKAYRAPLLSLAGSTDTPERMAALAPLWQGDIEKALPLLKRLAEDGDVGSALLLAGLYRRKGKLPIPVDPMQSLHLYRIASVAGSGEASERIAEMLEAKELPVQVGDAAVWRALAVKQGWREQRLATYCFGWTHGPEPLHCDANPPAITGNITPEVAERCPTENEMTLLRNEGVTGRISMNGSVIRHDPGPQARAILILDHAVPREADLLEPDATSLIYIQTPQDRWHMIPQTAPLLDRFLILTPEAAGRGQMSLGAQAVDGSVSGGACSSFAPL